MIGELAILNVAAGDTKLSFDPKKPAEVKRACAVVQDMLRRGFCILIEVGANDKGPLYQKVREFDPKTAEYIIAGDPPEQEASNAEPSSPPPRRTRRGQAGTRRVPAAKSTGTAIAPIAGG